MQPISIRYKIIAAISILILSAVQFFFLYNTYTLQSAQASFTERDMINSDYTKLIANDKLYRGGSKIIDSIFNKQVGTLEQLYYHNPKKFKSSSTDMMQKIFHDLIKGNNLDSSLDSMISNRGFFKNGYKYALSITKFEIAFHPSQYVQIYPFNSDPYKIIGGTLKNIQKGNIVTALTISDPSPKSYRIIFRLNIDNNNKTLLVLLKMLPTLLLSFTCIASVVVLFTMTYNNWIKQKKLAEMQSDFINSISHEFNTPLTAIIIANKSLQNPLITPAASSIGKLTDIIKRQTDRLDDLFGQVLNLTKMNAGNLQRKKIPLIQTIQNIVDDYTTKIDNSHTIILITNELQSEQQIEIDLFWFTTLIQNVIENGIKYNSNEIKRITIKIAKDKKAIILSMEDNGIGMTEKTVAHIFEKFYRHSPKSTSAGGLGLGLFYAKQCITMHQWQMDIKSTPNIGTSFIITLH